MSRDELDAKIAEEVAKVAPRWPDPARKEDAVQALRYPAQQNILIYFATQQYVPKCVIKKYYNINN